MIIQMVTMSVKAGHLEEFLEAIRFNYEGTRKEPGNYRFDVLCDPENDHHITIYEVFDSEAAKAAHHDARHYQECVSIITPICEGKRTKVFYNAVYADFIGT